MSKHANIPTIPTLIMLQDIVLLSAVMALSLTHRSKDVWMSAQTNLYFMLKMLPRLVYLYVPLILLERIRPEFVWLLVPVAHFHIHKTRSVFLNVL